MSKNHNLLYYDLIVLPPGAERPDQVLHDDDYTPLTHRPKGDNIETFSLSQNLIISLKNLIKPQQEQNNPKNERRILHSSRQLRNAIITLDNKILYQEEGRQFIIIGSETNPESHDRFSIELSRLKKHASYIRGRRNPKLLFWTGIGLMGLTAAISGASWLCLSYHLIAFNNLEILGGSIGLSILAVTGASLIIASFLATCNNNKKFSRTFKLATANPATAEENTQTDKHYDL